MADFATSSNAAVQAQLNRIIALSPGCDILGLERISALMKMLGNPHQRLPPVFHIAGTNGKGSTCAFLRAAIEAAGLKAHVYSSPHLIRFNERIRLAGTLISDKALAAVLMETLDKAEENNLNPSFFEATTAAAFLAFSRTPADATIIEVGLGGRLDATNIIEEPAVCGIANLGIDHEKFLLSPEDGAPKLPLTRIAWEKAGIAKPNVPLVVGHYQDAMNAIITKHAAIIGAPLVVKKQIWDAAQYDDKLHYKDDKSKISVPAPRMNGHHQNENAALAIAMLRHQNAIIVSETAIAAAMEWAHWPARLQKLPHGPLTIHHPSTEIWLDGGHNVNAGLILADHFKAQSNTNERHIHLIIAMLSNKNPSAIIVPLKNMLKSISVLPITGHECHDIAAFKDPINKHDINISAADNINKALQSIGNIGPEDIILIAGSLYLAGEVLEANEQVID